jgi:2-succinyl-5-enolpyruvyl-6-hydroxy-3-cyclohexene-1-carboxylate synthase
VTGSVELARTVVDELVRGGVHDVVLSPGSRSGPVALALAHADEAGRLRLHVRVDERGAGFLAIGLIRATSRPVPVVCTSGTAVANLHPAVLEAHHAGLPLVALTPDRPAELRGVGANQTTDHRGVLADAVRSYTSLAAALPPRGPYWRSAVARALAVATTTPGPVQVNLELSDPLVPTPETLPTPDGRLDGAPWTSVTSPRPGAQPVTLDCATPTVVVAGDGAGAAADEVASRAGWPVLAEPTSGVWGAPSTIPAAPAVLTAGFLARHSPRRVVVYGRPTLARPVLALLVDDAVEVVVVPSVHAEWPDPGHRAAVVAGSVKPRGDPRPGWVEQWRSAGAEAWMAIQAVLTAHPWPVEPLVAAEAVAAAPAGSAMLLGSSQPIRDVHLAAAPRADIVLHANRGLAGIDGTVSTAVGLALGHGGVAYALVGDLSFLHDTTGLFIGENEPRPDLTVVVVNNAGGGIFGLLEPGGLERGDLAERVYATPVGADIAGLCAAAGVEHTRPTSVTGLREALLPRPGLRVVEVRTHRDRNRALHEEMRAAAAAAIG